MFGDEGDAVTINGVLKYVLPDLTIGTLYNDNSRMGYESIYKTVNHELAHSSHFSQVGSPFGQNISAT